MVVAMDVEIVTAIVGAIVGVRVVAVWFGL